MRIDSFIAGNASRSLAYLADLAAASFAFLLLNALCEAFGVNVARPLFFGLVVFAYHSYFLLERDGVSFGKYLRNICVISATGSKLRPAQALLRAAFIALPYAGLGGESVVPRVVALQWPGAVPLLAVLAVAWLFADLVLLEFTVAPRTLTDRVARTLVVNLPPPQPHRAPAFPMYSASDEEFGHRPPGPKERK
jgi:uncharacterized RDD family membrane protein YckC